MASGSAGDAYVCASTGGNFVAGPIIGDVGGQQVEMNIVKLSFQGAGSYPAGGVSFDSGTDHFYPATGTNSVVVVGADLRSGTLDIQLAANSNPNAVAGHAAGSWRCPPDAI